MTPSNKRPSGRYFTDAQLENVSANRGKRSRIEGVGSVVQRAAEHTPVNDQALAVRDAILGLVDDQFVRHCRLGSVSGGRVFILVDNPDYLYDIRVRWHLPIKEHLERILRGMTVRGIVFKRGDQGLSFAADE